MEKQIHPDIEILQIVAKALGDLLENVVFVGGATTTLYIDDPASAQSLATEDVDCIVELSNLLSFDIFDHKLSKLGFKHPMDGEGAPICRRMLGNIKVDMMPTDPKFFGFSNRWYPEGVLHKTECVLPNGQKVYTLSVPFFIATKMEAMRDRGGNDLRFSHDLEDIILVLSGCSNALSSLKASPTSVKGYLMDSFAALLKNPYFEESIDIALNSRGEDLARSELVLKIVSEIIKK